MRYLLWTLLFLLTACAHHAPARETPNALAFLHVTLIDATGAPARPDTTVVVVDGRITAVGKTGEVQVPPGARVVDGTGRYLIPGLWDMHVHTLSEGFKPGPAIEDVVALYVANGLTGVREMGYYPDTTLTLKQRIAAGELLGPRIIAGAMVDGPQPDWPFGLATNSPEEGRALVRSLKERGFDFVKVYSLLPRDTYLAIADEARQVGIPFAGHVPVSVSPVEAARAGQRSFEHLGDMLTLQIACSTWEQEARARFTAAFAAPDIRAAASKALSKEDVNAMLASYDAQRCATLIEHLAQAGTWQVPTLRAIKVHIDRGAPELLEDPRQRYLPPTVRGLWEQMRRAPRLEEKRAERERTIYREVVTTMHRAGVRLMAGTDSPIANIYPGFSLHDELVELVELGLTPMEALQAATREPARFLGLEATLGTVEPGKEADLVLLRANPLEDIRNTREIEAVVLRGRVLTRPELDAMLEGVETRAH